MNAEGRTRKEGKAEKLTLPKKDEFEDARINAFGKGTGKLQADRALEWVRKNLSLQTNNWVTDVITNNELKIASAFKLPSLPTVSLPLNVLPEPAVSCPSS